MSSRNRMNRDNPYLQTPLGRIARELLQREAPPSYNMAVEGVEHEVHESSRRSSSRSGRRRSRRRRHRNREPSIRRAQPSEAREERNNREDSNLISGSPSDESTHARGIDEPQPPMTNILRSLGLGETSDAGPSTCRPRDVASTSRSRKDPEQAGPLPSKKKIAPVMVGAPCGGEMTADIAGCVYPNPPTYREAVGGEEVEVLAPPVVEDDHVGVVEDAGRRRFWRNGNFWRSPLSYFRTSRTFQQLHDNDSTSMESMRVDMVSLGGNEQSTSG
uniref:Uncharacterized protein n=2 Tax=Ciona intestinalis TaxID=7719 RepID=F6QCY9_CIOIN